MTKLAPDDSDSCTSRRRILCGALALGAQLVLPGCDDPKCLLLTPPEPGEAVINRLIYVLMDLSGSGSPDEVKGLVKQLVIDRAAAGDWLYGFVVAEAGGVYPEKQGEVFSPAASPRIPRNVATGAVSKETLARQCSSVQPLRAELEGAWKSFDTQQGLWAARLAKTNAPDQSISPYLTSLRYLSQRFHSSPEALEKWLVVVGDLGEDPDRSIGLPADLDRRVAAEASSLKEKHGAVFERVKVRMVCRHDGKRRLADLWSDAYFKPLGAQDLRVTPFEEKETGGLDRSNVPRL